MSERLSPSKLLKKINKYMISSDVDSLTPQLYEFIDNEYNKELNEKINEEEKKMEEIEFHNLTTVHNISKLWEILHTPFIIKRGRKSKKSPINQEKLETLKSSVNGIITGFEAPPNPAFSIGGYIIPDDIKFTGPRLGRKPASLKNYSFTVEYNAALREHKAAVANQNPESVNIVNNSNVSPNVNTSNINNNVKPATLTVLNDDQFNNSTYHIDLYKKDIVPPPVLSDPSSANKDTVKSLKNTNTANYRIINKYTIVNTPDPLEGKTVEAYIPPPRTLSYTALKKLSKPDPIVERMDVFRARMRNPLGPFIANQPKQTEPVLANNTVKIEKGIFVPSYILSNPNQKTTSPISPRYEPKSEQSTNTATIPCILNPADLVFPPKIPRQGPGRPIGSKNKTPEEKEQIRLNKKPKGRPRGSPNKKATKKKDDAVIIYDNEVALRTYPNKFEVHMLQYTLENPHVSYAEWTTHSDKMLEKAKDKIKETSRQNIDEWKKNTMREINVLKGRLSVGKFKDVNKINIKGKSKVEYKQEEEDDYRYELLETKKDDPFFINLLKQSLDLRSSRKTQINDIGSSKSCPSNVVEVPEHSHNKLEIVEPESVESDDYRYELLETKKDDPFFINLLKQSIELRSSRFSRKLRSDDKGSSSGCSNNAVGCEPSKYVYNNDKLEIINHDNHIKNIDVKDNSVDDLIDFSDAEVVGTVDEHICKFYMEDLLEKEDKNRLNVIDNMLINLHDNTDADMNIQTAMKTYLTICQLIYPMFNPTD